MDAAVQVGLTLFVLIIALLVIGVPISYSMGIASVIAMFSILNSSMVASTSAQRIFTGTNSFSLLAIPFFILAGTIMNNGGIARRLINFAKLLIGFVPGALAHTNIVANMLFGAISGSAVASSAAIGGVMTPLEKEEGYDPKFSAAVNIASAPCGMLIPPSNLFIVFSMVSGGASVAALFMAGYIPGIIWGFAVLAVALVYANKKGYKSEAVKSAGEGFKVFIDAIPALLLIVIIVGGILSGIFTPTEASCIAVVYSLLLAFGYKAIKIKQLPALILDASKTTGMIIFMIGVSSIMSWLMAYVKIPTLIANTLLGLTDSKVLILLMMNFILLIVGTFMDPTPAVLIFTPIFLPIAQNLGIETVHFGIIMVFNLCIGTITPPVGPVLFTGCKIAELKIEDVIGQLLPFFGILILMLLLIIFIPELSLWLPRLMNLC